MVFKCRDLIIALLTTALILLPRIATTNVDCKGKAFHCVNSTHFKICVDFGGVSKTVDDFLIPCPPSTACTDSNYYECEYQIPTTLAPLARQSDVTNELFETTVTSPWELLDVNTFFPVNNNGKSVEWLENSTIASPEIVSTAAGTETVDIINHKVVNDEVLNDVTTESEYIIHKTTVSDLDRHKVNNNLTTESENNDSESTDSILNNNITSLTLTDETNNLSDHKISANISSAAVTVEDYSTTKSKISIDVFDITTMSSTTEEDAYFKSTNLFHSVITDSLNKNNFTTQVTTENYSDTKSEISIDQYTPFITTLSDADNISTTLSFPFKTDDFGLNITEEATENYAVTENDTTISMPQHVKTTLKNIDGSDDFATPLLMGLMKTVDSGLKISLATETTEKSGSENETLITNNKVNTHYTTGTEQYSTASDNNPLIITATTTNVMYTNATVTGTRTNNETVITNNKGNLNFTKSSLSAPMITEGLLNTPNIEIYSTTTSDSYSANTEQYLTVSDKNSPTETTTTKEMYTNATVTGTGTENETVITNNEVNSHFTTTTLSAPMITESLLNTPNIEIYVNATSNSYSSSAEQYSTVSDNNFLTETATTTNEIYTNATVTDTGTENETVITNNKVNPHFTKPSLSAPMITEGLLNTPNIEIYFTTTSDSYSANTDQYLTVSDKNSPTETTTTTTKEMYTNATVTETGTENETVITNNEVNSHFTTTTLSAPMITESLLNTPNIEIYVNATSNSYSSSAEQYSTVSDNNFPTKSVTTTKEMYTNATVTGTDTENETVITNNKVNSHFTTNTLSSPMITESRLNTPNIEIYVTATSDSYSSSTDQYSTVSDTPTNEIYTNAIDTDTGTENETVITNNKVNPHFTKTSLSAPMATEGLQNTPIIEIYVTVTSDSYSASTEQYSTVSDNNFPTETATTTKEMYTNATVTGTGTENETVITNNEVNSHFTTTTLSAPMITESLQNTPNIEIYVTGTSDSYSASTEQYSTVIDNNVPTETVTTTNEIYTNATVTDTGTENETVITNNKVTPHFPKTSLSAPMITEGLLNTPNTEMYVTATSDSYSPSTEQYLTVSDKNSPTETATTTNEMYTNATVTGAVTELETLITTNEVNSHFTITTLSAPMMTKSLVNTQNIEMNFTVTSDSNPAGTEQYATVRDKNYLTETVANTNQMYTNAVTKTSHSGLDGYSLNENGMNINKIDEISPSSSIQMELFPTTTVNVVSRDTLQVSLINEQNNLSSLVGSVESLNAEYVVTPSDITTVTDLEQTNRQANVLYTKVQIANEDTIPNTYGTSTTKLDVTINESNLMRENIANSFTDFNLTTKSDSSEAYVQKNTPERELLETTSRQPTTAIDLIINSISYDVNFSTPTVNGNKFHKNVAKKVFNNTIEEFFRHENGTYKNIIDAITTPLPQIADFKSTAKTDNVALSFIDSLNDTVQELSKKGKNNLSSPVTTGSPSVTEITESYAVNTKQHMDVTKVKHSIFSTVDETIQNNPTTQNIVTETLDGTEHEGSSHPLNSSTSTSKSNTTYTAKHNIEHTINLTKTSATQPSLTLNDTVQSFSTLEPIFNLTGAYEISPAEFQNMPSTVNNVFDYIITTQSYIRDKKGVSSHLTEGDILKTRLLNDKPSGSTIGTDLNPRALINDINNSVSDDIYISTSVKNTVTENFSYENNLPDHVIQSSTSTSVIDSFDVNTVVSTLVTGINNTSFAETNSLEIFNKSQDFKTDKSSINVNIIKELSMSTEHNLTEPSVNVVYLMNSSIDKDRNNIRPTLKTNSNPHKSATNMLKKPTAKLNETYLPSNNTLSTISDIGPLKTKNTLSLNQNLSKDISRQHILSANINKDINATQEKPTTRESARSGGLNVQEKILKSVKSKHLTLNHTINHTIQINGEVVNTVANLYDANVKNIKITISEKKQNVTLDSVNKSTVNFNNLSINVEDFSKPDQNTSYKIAPNKTKGDDTNASHFIINADNKQSSSNPVPTNEDKRKVLITKITPVKLNSLLNNDPESERTESKFNCNSRQRGKYSDKNDCQNFYICIGRGEPIFGKCPNNTVFSEISKQCTRNLSHCIRNNQFQCTSAGRYVDILSDHFYYICAKKVKGDIRYKFQCQKGYHLDKSKLKCIFDTFNDSLSASELPSLDMDMDVSNEESSKTDGEKSTIESKSKEGKDSKKQKKDFECKKEGKFLYPDDCRKYYQCTKSRRPKFRRKIKKCDSDEVFDNEKSKCVDEESYEC